MVNQIQKTKNGYLVDIDGTVYTLLEDVIVEFHLIPGKETTKKSLKEIMEANALYEKKHLCLKYLQKQKSVHEFKTYARSLMVTEKVIEEWTVYFKQKGYLDDDYYAKMIVEKYQYRYGWQKIESILIEKGFHPDLIHRMSNLLPNDVLNDLMDKYLKVAKKQNTKELKQTLIRKLLSSGFNLNDIQTVLNEKIQEVKIDEMASIRKEIPKLNRKYEGLPEQTKRIKILKALMQKGFQYEYIQKALNMEDNHVQNFE